MYPLTVSDAVLPRFARRAVTDEEHLKDEIRWWASYGRDEEDFFWVLPSAVQPLARQRYMASLARRLHGKQTLVDYGCGNGWTTRVFAPHVAEAVGLDFSEDQLRLASATDAGSNIRYECIRSVDGLPEADAYVFHGVLHHLSTYEIAELFMRVKHRARPGALLAVIEPHCFPGSPTGPEAAEQLGLAQQLLDEISKKRAMLGLAYSQRTQEAVNSLDTRWWGLPPYGPSPLEKPFERDELRDFLDLHMEVESDDLVQALQVSQAVSGQLALVTHDWANIDTQWVNEILGRADAVEASLLSSGRTPPDTGWYMRLILGTVRSL